MEENNEVTAAWASIGDVSECSARVDGKVRAVLGAGAGAAPQRGGRVRVCDGAGAGGEGELLGHRRGGRDEGPHRMQALLGSYRWDWGRLRGELAGLAAAWLACDPDDLPGPGIAIDETAQLKHGEATACVAPQHAGITGQVETA